MRVVLYRLQKDRHIYLVRNLTKKCADAFVQTAAGGQKLNGKVIVAFLVLPAVLAGAALCLQILASMRKLFQMGQRTWQ